MLERDFKNLQTTNPRTILTPSNIDQYRGASPFDAREQD